MTTNILSCEWPDCLDLATIRVVVGHSGQPSKSSCLCAAHMSDGMLQIGLLATELLGSNNHIQILVFPLS